MAFPNGVMAYVSAAVALTSLLADTSALKAYAKISESFAVQIFRQIESNIVSNHQYCVTMDIVFESASHSFGDPLVGEYVRDQDSSTTVPVLMTGLSSFPINESDTLPYTRQYSARYRRPYSVVYFKLDPFLNGEKVIPSNAIGDWPDNIALRTASPMTQTFFVFYTFNSRWQATDVYAFSNLTALILHSVFIVPAGQTVQIFKDIPQLPRTGLTSLGHFSTNRKFKSDRNDDPKLFTEIMSFHGEPTLVLTHAHGTPDPHLLETTGVLSGIMYGPIYKMLTRFNATFVAEEIFGVPGVGTDEHGNLDNFIIPLVEGTAAMTAVLKGNAEISKYVYLSHPYLHDGVKFTTGLPQKKKIKSLHALRNPFGRTLWLVACFTAVSMVITLEIISHVHQHESSKRKLFWAILQSILDQQCFSDKRMTQDMAVHMSMGAWLLGLIVIGCAYKTRLTAVITIPRYTFPPRTFEELLASSYDIGAVMYTNSLENDVKFSKNAISAALQDRIFEYDYLEPYVRHQ